MAEKKEPKQQSRGIGDVLKELLQLVPGQRAKRILEDKVQPALDKANKKK